MTTEQIALDALQSHPKNYNAHSSQQIAKIAKSLSTFGQVRSIVTWHNTILAGHGVVLAAKSLGWDTIRADVQDHLTESQALAYVVADNELARQSDPDQAQLAAILEELQAKEPLLVEAAGYSAQELEQLLRLVNPPAVVDSEPQIDRAEELQKQWGTSTGQLWALGEHRLICGDCTEQKVVARVMGGERAALTVTSPPYPDAEMWETSADELIDLGYKTIQSVYDISVDGGVLCWNTADVPRSNEGMAPNTARDTMQAYAIGWRKRGDIVWEKGMSYLPLPSFTRRPTVPNCTHEAILVFFKGDWKPRDPKGQLDELAMAWNRESVWKMKTESAKAMGHKAPFPLDLAIRCITLWSLEDDSVYDPFAGSGTTGIACHNLGRRARMVEISPAYCGVILERFAQIGVTPELVESSVLEAA